MSPWPVQWAGLAGKIALEYVAKSNAAGSPSWDKL